MKKAIFASIVILALSGLGQLSAQTYLSKNFEPIEKREFKYNPCYPGVKNYEDEMGIGAFRYTNGFTLRNGVLYTQAEEWAYVVFSLKGQYEKLSFIVGYTHGVDQRWSAEDDGTHIVTVKADGRRIFDEVIRDWHAPREVVLDISGVDELRFDHLKGLYSVGFAEVRLWKKGETPRPAANPLASVISKQKVNLMEEIKPHFLCHRGWSVPITKQYWPGVGTRESIRMNRIDYTTGFNFGCSQELGKGISQGFAYFWLQKSFDKVSLLIGPEDANSSNAKGWFTVKADGKIIYEKLITQEDLVEQVVLDVKGVNVLSMHSGELEQSDFLGGLRYGVVDIYAYKQGYSAIPTPGIANTAKEKISKFKDATRLCSSLEPYSVRGKSAFKDIYFNGASSYYHFSMGGEQFDEGFILASGESFMNGTISAYVEYDLAGEFDWLSFTVGTLSKHRVLGEDHLLVYADDNLVLDTEVHCLWPNQKFTIPIGKCRRLKFTKPGTGGDKQTYIGVGDVMVFRGEPQDTEPFFYHRKPEITETADLIDLCEQPYFHYVGRYLSSLTNFDFNDCFKNGSSRKERFDMKDGSQIYKGIMLETNVPPALAFEDITLEEAIFIFMMGAGSAMSSSSVAAATGVSAGAGIAGAMAAGYSVLNLVDKGHQSAVAAFNPYGEYESLTFTVANKSAYSETDALGRQLDPENPVELYVFADMVKVGEFLLTNNMPSTTFTVPINKCTQLVFWLQCGDTRSGQYVLYDMTVSKEILPPTEPRFFSERPSVRTQVSSEAAPSTTAPIPSSSKSSKGGRKAREEKVVVWERPPRSGAKYLDSYMKDADDAWNATAELQRQASASYSTVTTYLMKNDGGFCKAVSLVDAAGRECTFQEAVNSLSELSNAASSMRESFSVNLIGSANASLDLPSLGLGAIEWGKRVKNATEVIKDCISRCKSIGESAEDQKEGILALFGRGTTIDGVSSGTYTILLPIDSGENVPEGPKQQLKYFKVR